MAHSPTTTEPTTAPNSLFGGFSRALRRLGEPASLSWPVAALYLPFGLFGPLLVDPPRLGGSVFTWFIVGIAGQGALFATLVIGHSLARRRAQLNPMVTVCVLVAAVLLRAVTLATVAQALGVAPTWEIGYRLVAAAGPQTGVLVLIAVIVSNQANNARITAELQSARISLEQASERAEAALQRRQDNIRITVQGMVTPLMRVLDDAGQRAVADRIEVQESVRRIIDNELRPLSHSLASADFESPEPPPDGPTRAFGTFAWPASVPVSMLLRPVAAGIMAFLLTVSQAVRGLPWPDAAAFPLVFSAIVVMVLLLAARSFTWAPRLWFGLILAATLTSATYVIALNLTDLFGIAVPPMLNGPAIATGLYVGLMLAGISAANVHEQRMQADLRQSLEDLRIHSSVLRQQDFLARKQMSYIIHGSIQSSLHAASLKLASTSNPSPGLIADIRADINAALARLEPTTAPYVLLVQSLDDIAELWDGTATVRWTLDHRTVRQLVQMPATGIAVSEIATESVANAIRHGRATEVWLAIEAHEDRIVVRVVDNGAGLAAGCSPGLGSHMFDELCLTWHRTSDALGTIVTAELAAPATVSTPLSG